MEDESALSGFERRFGRDEVRVGGERFEFVSVVGGDAKSVDASVLNVDAEVDRGFPRPFGFAIKEDALNAFETRGVDANDDVAWANRRRARGGIGVRRRLETERVEGADEPNVFGRGGIERFGVGGARRVERRPSAGRRPVEVGVRRAVRIIVIGWSAG